MEDKETRSNVPTNMNTLNSVIVERILLILNDQSNGF